MRVRPRSKSLHAWRRALYEQNNTEDHPVIRCDNFPRGEANDIMQCLQLQYEAKIGWRSGRNRLFPLLNVMPQLIILRPTRNEIAVYGAQGGTCAALKLPVNYSQCRTDALFQRIYGQPGPAAGLSRPRVRREWSVFIEFKVQLRSEQVC